MARGAKNAFESQIVSQARSDRAASVHQLGEFGIAEIKQTSLDHRHVPVNPKIVWQTVSRANNRYNLLSTFEQARYESLTSCAACASNKYLHLFVSVFFRLMMLHIVGCDGLKEINGSPKSRTLSNP
jgi:hypothetical protein